jgi:predicted Fe-S protein YdhL (DUF1289 family)
MILCDAEVVLAFDQQTACKTLQRKGKEICKWNLNGIQTKQH